MFDLKAINKSCYGVVDSVSVEGTAVTVETSYEAFGDYEEEGSWTERETVTFEHNPEDDLNDAIYDEVSDALCLWQWGGYGEDRAEKVAMACDM